MMLLISNMENVSRGPLLINHQCCTSINTFKRQSKSENELSLSVLTCIRKIVFWQCI